MDIDIKSSNILIKNVDDNGISYFYFINYVDFNNKILYNVKINIKNPKKLYIYKQV